MIQELKHGNLDVKLQICNEAFIDAIPKFEADKEVSFTELQSVGFSTFLFYFAYFSYKVYCNENGQIRKYNCAQFLKEINREDVKESDSNINEVVEALANSFIEKAKKKATGQKESSAGNISTESLSES